MKWTPHKYQMDAMKFMLKHPESGMFLDPGEGKTSITLGTASIRKQKKQINGILVVATMKILDHDVWPKEIAKWDFGFTHTILHGKDKDKNLKKDVDVYLINYEGLHWLSKNIKHLKADMLVLDESSKVKSFRSARFKILKKMLSKFKYRHLLTGTPAAQSYMDLFSQIYVLDEGERLGRYITHFRNEYFEPTGFKGYTYELQKGAEKRLFKAISPIVYRTSVDHLKIPKEKYNDIILELPKKLMKQYVSLEEEFIAEFKNGTITAVNAGVMTQKLRQFANGRIYDADRNIVSVHDLKKDAAIDYVEELQGNPTLIGYEFKHDLQALQEAFPKAAHIGSGVKKSESLRIEKAWNAGKIPVLIGQISVVAHGLNLQESGFNMMLYSHIYKLEDVIQFIRRLRRQGQKKRVIVTRLIIKDTIDEHIIHVNQAGKARNQNSLLTAMKKRLINN